ncbi:TonB-dependent receptor plug domain-containing protein [Xanthomonas arboricola]|uniref:TonB-dependent receptor plug domain-containing protein n=1 Tax=Xanthomonas arboricola TaxID=56448 RepID=UPI003989B2C3
MQQQRSTGLALALFAAAQASPLHAQTATQQQRNEPATLAALKVTAQKREESLQNVPVVVSVLPEQLLQDSGVHDIKELQVLVPGLIVTSSQSAAQTTARIRGIGTVGDNAGLESSVGVVIDGVARARNGVGFADLGELERIEVLKGPQGTVFGKNTSAGVINVVTRRPSFTRNADAEITVGNYGALGIAGAFNDALGDTSALRVYAAGGVATASNRWSPGPAHAPPATMATRTCALRACNGYGNPAPTWTSIWLPTTPAAKKTAASPSPPNVGRPQH